MFVPITIPITMKFMFLRIICQKLKTVNPRYSLITTHIQSLEILLISYKKNSKNDLKISNLMSQTMKK